MIRNTVRFVHLIALQFAAFEETTWLDLSGMATVIWLQPFPPFGYFNSSWPKGQSAPHPRAQE